MARGKPPSVDARRKGRRSCTRTVLSESAMFSDHSLDLDSGNGRLNFDPSGGNDFVFGLLLCGEFLPPRLSHGLNDGRITRCIALITGVLPQKTGIGKGILCLRDCLVMRLARDGCSRKQDKPCKGGNHRILNRMLLLFSAVKVRLNLRISRPRNLPLSGIMDELMKDLLPAPLLKHLFELGPSLRREHSGCIHGIPEYLREHMDPLSTLLFGHTEPGRMVFLCWVVFEESKYEKQTLFHRWERTVGLYAVTLAGGSIFCL